MKRIGPKRVRVVEVGAGTKPIGIIGQAIRAGKKRRGRSFIASDINLNLNDTLRSFGLSKVPSNAKVLKECSIKTLQGQSPKSADIIFGGFFFNGLRNSSRSEIEYLSKINEFFRQTKRVLTKNGRLIFIAHNSEAFMFKANAAELGYSAHIIPFNEKMIQNSTSEWVQRTGTRAGLEDFFMVDHAMQDSSFVKNAKLFSKITGLGVMDSARPALVIMKRLKQ